MAKFFKRTSTATGGAPTPVATTPAQSSNGSSNSNSSMQTTLPTSGGSTISKSLTSASLASTTTTGTITTTSSDFSAATSAVSAVALAQRKTPAVVVNSALSSSALLQANKERRLSRGSTAPAFSELSAPSTTTDTTNAQQLQPSAPDRTATLNALSPTPTNRRSRIIPMRSSVALQPAPGVLAPTVPVPVADTMALGTTAVAITAATTTTNETQSEPAPDQMHLAPPLTVASSKRQSSTPSLGSMNTLTRGTHLGDDAAKNVLSAQRALRPTVKMQGWIQRQQNSVDEGQTWKTVYAVLEGGFLHFYLDEAQTYIVASANKFALNCCHCEPLQDPEQSKSLSCLLVSADDSRQDVLAFFDVDAEKQWIVALVRASKRPPTEFSDFERSFFSENELKTLAGGNRSKPNMNEGINKTSNPSSPAESPQHSPRGGAPDGPTSFPLSDCPVNINGFALTYANEPCVIVSEQAVDSKTETTTTTTTTTTAEDVTVSDDQQIQVEHESSQGENGIADTSPAQDQEEPLAEGNTTARTDETQEPARQGAQVKTTAATHTAVVMSTSDLQDMASKESTTPHMAVMGAEVVDGDTAENSIIATETNNSSSQLSPGAEPVEIAVHNTIAETGSEELLPRDVKDEIAITASAQAVSPLLETTACIETTEGIASTKTTPTPAKTATNGASPPLAGKADVIGVHRSNENTTSRPSPPLGQTGRATSSGDVTRRGSAPVAAPIATLTRVNSQQSPAIARKAALLLGLSSIEEDVEPMIQPSLEKKAAPVASAPQTSAPKTPAPQVSAPIKHAAVATGATTPNKTSGAAGSVTASPKPVLSASTSTSKGLAVSEGASGRSSSSDLHATVAGIDAAVGQTKDSGASRLNRLGGQANVNRQSAAILRPMNTKGAIEQPGVAPMRSATQLNGAATTSSHGSVPSLTTTTAASGSSIAAATVTPVSTASAEATPSTTSSIPSLAVTPSVAVKSRSIKMQGYIYLHTSDDPQSDHARKFFFELQGGFLVWMLEAKNNNNIFLAADSMSKGRLSVGEMQLGHEGVRQLASSISWIPGGSAAKDELWFFFSFTVTTQVKKREETTILSDDKNARPIEKVRTVLVRQSTEYSLASKNRVELQQWLSSIEAMMKLEKRRTTNDMQPVATAK